MEIKSASLSNNWLSNKNKDGYYIHCYDIDTNKTYPANIKNIAEEKYFYKIGKSNE